jgi:hypothetical protein
MPHHWFIGANVISRRLADIMKVQYNVSVLRGCVRERLIGIVPCIGPTTDSLSA